MHNIWAGNVRKEERGKKKTQKTLVGYWEDEQIIWDSSPFLKFCLVYYRLGGRAGQSPQFVGSGTPGATMITFTFT